jgi:polyisoprenoid-binding protein YceI
VPFTHVVAQNKFFTRTGHISFYSKTPLEDIQASNRQAASIIDFSTGDIVFSVLMKSFEFPKALMQEHFNESYVESDKYPKSTFKGKITNVQTVNVQKNGSYTVEVEGELMIHGVSRPLKTTGTLEVKDLKIHGKSTFTVAVADYNIQIPRLVRDNIAKHIDIQIDMVYEPFKQ